MFPSFPYFCVLVCLKSHIVSIGAKIVFSRNCQDVKKCGFQKRKWQFLSLPFYVGKGQNRNYEKKTQKENCKNAQKNRGCHEKGEN